MINNDLIALGAEFMNITVDEFTKRMSDYSAERLEQWSEMGIERYYNETDAYIYGLVQFNDTERVDNLLHCLKYMKPMRILDYGAGIGVVASELAKKHTVFYYDLPSKTKEFAQFINNKANKQYTVIDSAHIALQLTLDCVVCVDVLEHLVAPMALVHQITASLKTNGLFLTTGLDFSVGEHIPMHLVENRQYINEYNKYMNTHYTLAYYHPTKNEVIYLWRKK